MSGEELKPAACPFCGDEYVELKAVGAISHGFAVECLNCETVGPKNFDTDEGRARRSATYLWNERAHPLPEQPQEGESLSSTAALEAEIASLKQRLESAEVRGCTCHPDERPPVCQRRYALTDCLNLDAVKKAADLVFRIEAAGAWEYEGGNFERWKAEARRIAPDLRALQEQEKQNG